MTHRQRVIPLWFKIAYTAFVAALVWPYSLGYGFPNFLWFSNIALVSMVPAVWLQWRLWTSMQLISVGVLEVVWTLDFLAGLVLGDSVIGLTAYMFDERVALYLRLFSLFHVLITWILLWLVWRLGYDRRAWWAQTLLAWAILLVTYLFTPPHYNINWAFGLGESPQTVLPSWLYLVLIMLAFPVVVYLPSHVLVSWLMRRFRQTRERAAVSATGT